MGFEFAEVPSAVASYDEIGKNKYRINFAVTVKGHPSEDSSVGVSEVLRAIVDSFSANISQRVQDASREAAEDANQKELPTKKVL